MKQYLSLFGVCILCMFSTGSFAQKQAKSLRDTVSGKDSIEYYEVEIGVNQKDYRELLKGIWSIDTMRRQARAVPENLADVTIRFTSDTTFSLQTNCNNIEGTYRLKGTSVKFTPINSSNHPCETLDRDAALQRLLSGSVSAYTVENHILLLRDGSSNVVFRGHRKSD